MSVLDEVLQEEYERLARMKRKLIEEYDSLPKGCLSKKRIRGKEYCYLQHREGNRIVGQYIKKDEVDEYASKIEKRRSIKRTIRQIESQMQKIERTIK